MPQTLVTKWIVTPLQSPRIWRKCRYCSTETPFSSSMKFRTNAHKKRIDVWLIYRCVLCGETWNLPIFERVPIGAIAPEQFQLIACNDPALAAHYAFDVIRLKRHSGRVEESVEFAIEKSKPEGSTTAISLIEISIALTARCGVRLDRLLSHELGVTRQALQTLLERKALSFSPSLRNCLRSPVAHGQRIAINLSLERVSAEQSAIIRKNAFS